MMQGFSQETSSYTFADSSVEVVNALFRRVYQWMAVGLILTAVTAYMVASSQAFLRFFYSSSVPLMVVAVAEVGLVLWLSMGINRISAGTAAASFAIYSVLNGILCSSVLLVYTQESVYTTFLSTAGMFGVMSVYGIYTRRNLTSLGSFLTMGLFGLIIAMVVNLFMGSSRMELIISALGIIIFLGLTAWDTWKIRQMGAQLEGGEDGVMMRKVAIIGALSLYLDFINIFLYLLRFMGKQRQ
ncbi:MAG: Bax inhibitor-1/YccA family protein [Fretibacterium sp.]|nr:Bax inhibitor-1/YccA family protein [Fretibacterium sp.]